jgi:hypothetical protein
MQMNRKTFAAAAAFAAVLFAGSAQAVPLAACSDADISPEALSCVGFISGNLLSNSPADITAQTNALASLGLTWDKNFNGDEKLSSLNGTHTLDFSTLLTGISYIGIHFGNGTGGPGNGTAFYKLDAGAGLDTITLAYNASSDAVLYSTSPVRGVPEPASWAMMIVGFLGVGGTLRRARRVTSAATA